MRLAGVLWKWWWNYPHKRSSKYLSNMWPVRDRSDNRDRSNGKAELRHNGFSHCLISLCHKYTNTGCGLLLHLNTHTAKVFNRKQIWTTGEHTEEGQRCETKYIYSLYAFFHYIWFPKVSMQQHNASFWVSILESIGIDSSSRSSYINLLVTAVFIYVVWYCSSQQPARYFVKVTHLLFTLKSPSCILTRI